MLDPRNSLADESVYQFMNFEGNNLSKEQIASIVEGTYLNNQEVIDALFDSASGANPEECSSLNAAFLVAKIIIEQGSNGSTLSKGEGYKGENHIASTPRSLIYSSFDIIPSRSPIPSPLESQKLLQ